MKKKPSKVFDVKFWEPVGITNRSIGITLPGIPGAFPRPAVGLFHPGWQCLSWSYKSRHGRQCRASWCYGTFWMWSSGSCHTFEEPPLGSKKKPGGFLEDFDIWTDDVEKDFWWLRIVFSGMPYEFDDCWWSLYWGFSWMFHHVSLHQKISWFDLRGRRCFLILKDRKR